MGYIMSRCKLCNLEISDRTQICPLCKTVLEGTDESCENQYPNIRDRTKKMFFWTRVFLFLAIIIEIIFIYFNYKYFDGVYWSLITGAGLFYIYSFLRLTVANERTGYKTKFIGLILLAVLYVVLIDRVTGFQGWSVNYALPGGLLILDLVTVVFMIWNRRNWQSYIMIELMNIALSLIPVVLFLMNIVTEPFVTFLNCIIAVLIFAGTVIIGDKKAIAELKRRFHV